MLVSKESLRFNFQCAEFDLQQGRDQEILGWVFNQFLYGEVTGIQCGYWLYRAPHLTAATFLAKQATEELSHVRRFLRILNLLGQRPQKPHSAVQFLSTGMMGGTWGEHVALEMAVGEGLVLSIFYAMVDTIGDPEIKKILEMSVLEEEGHVQFGERETLAWLEKYPRYRKIFQGSVLVQIIAMKMMKRFVSKKMIKKHPDHPVLKQFGAFYDHLIQTVEWRVQKLGISMIPLSQLSFLRKFELLFFLPLRKLFARWTVRQKLLTETYLDDPLLARQQENFRSKS